MATFRETFTGFSEGWKYLLGFVADEQVPLTIACRVALIKDATVLARLLLLNTYLHGYFLWV